MNLFLVTCVYKDGLSERSFRVVRASSEQDIVRHMIRDYSSWEAFIVDAIFPVWLHDKEEGPKDLWDSMNRVILTAEDSKKLRDLFSLWFSTLSPERLLSWIRRTRVDGGSAAQLAIHEIREIEEMG